jgi:LmbE family N-acetylglucosaminyl deacetylase
MTALAAAAGAQYINLREYDEYLYDTPEVRRAVIEVIRRTQAGLIFTHWADDYNLDHTTTYQLVRHGAMHACLPLIRTASAPLPAHPAVFCVEPHGPIPFPATHYVDVTAYEERKIELLKRHASQETAMQMAFKAGFDKLCRRPDAYWGEKTGCEYAECFSAMPARGAVKPYAVLP